MDTLRDIFAKVLAVPRESVVDTLAPENTPSWDSLTAIILLTEIEHAFTVRFEFDEAMAVKNFKDVCELVRSKGVAL